MVTVQGGDLSLLLKKAYIYIHLKLRQNKTLFISTAMKRESNLPIYILDIRCLNMFVSFAFVFTMCMQPFYLHSCIYSEIVARAKIINYLLIRPLFKNIYIVLFSVFKLSIYL